MPGVRYLWIARWREFQHYKPEPGRVPFWIKDYMKQLDADRYRSLTLAQRGLLASLRQAFSKAEAKLTCDRSKLSARLGATVYQRDLDALNHAGYIEVISRATLDRRLEEVYSCSRPEKEKEKEKEKDPPLPPVDGGNDGKVGIEEARPKEWRTAGGWPHGPPPDAVVAAENWIDGHGWDETFTPEMVGEELDRIVRRARAVLEPGDRDRLLARWETERVRREVPS